MNGIFRIQSYQNVRQIIRIRVTVMLWNAIFVQRVIVVLGVAFQAIPFGVTWRHIA